MSTFYLASIWFLQKLLKEASTSDYTRVNCMKFDSSFYHRSLHPVRTGTILAFSFSSLLPSFLPPISQNRLLANSFLLLSFCCSFHRGVLHWADVRGLEWDWAMCVDWNVYIKGKWMLIFHIKSMSLAQSQTWAKYSLVLTHHSAVAKERAWQW